MMEEELNKYDVPTWLIEALKSYDGLMSSEKGKIKGNKMKAKRQLSDLITKHEVEARLDELGLVDTFEVNGVTIFGYRETAYNDRLSELQKKGQS
jgi:hypothetical protein